MATSTCWGRTLAVWRALVAAFSADGFNVTVGDDVNNDGKSDEAWIKHLRARISPVPARPWVAGGRPGVDSISDLSGVYDAAMFLNPLEIDVRTQRRNKMTRERR